MGINKRLKELEDKVLGPIEPGSSKLHLFQPVVSEAEEVFFQRVYNIMEAYKGTNELPSPEERKLLEQGVNRLVHRVIDVFESTMNYWFYLDEVPDGKLLWAIRFWYFMMEFGRHMKQARAEYRISQENKSWKKYDKAWEEYEATLSPEEKIPLWSDESYEHFMKTYIFRSFDEVKKLKKKKAKVTA